jgi:serine/threonine protein kinase/tetratricopeptide (TPR) repeat protein
MTIEIGTQLGPYDILELLGVGGMGEVYRARDAKLGRNIAIKVLREDFSSDKERLSRFEKEARLASALNHPNIITIYQIGEAAGAPYIAMELVEGKTLRELLRARRLSLPEILTLATQIASGMAKAHGAGITHRDLKPENIMISADGFIKILDFGLGKLAPLRVSRSSITTLAQSELETKHGMILGTVDYMSPEQARGENVDFRSDQFSFGSVLYEILAGERPFRRDSAIQSLAAIIEDEPKPITSRAPGVPESLVRILRRCLEKDRERRYASTQDLAAELSSLQTDGIAKGKIPSPPRRNKSAMKALWATGLIAALVIGVRLSARAVDGWQNFSQSLQIKLGILAPVPEKKNVLVLPFRAVGGGADDQALADGLTEVLTTAFTRLTTLPTLQVVPAAETRRLKIDTPEKARTEIGSNLVVEGNLERLGTKIRVRCTLVDPSTRKQLRSRKVMADAAELGRLPDNIFDAAVQMLALDLKPPQRVALKTRDDSIAAAKEQYLRGRGYFQKHGKAENIDSAIRFLEQAVALDPKYALAYAALGEAYWQRYQSKSETQWIDRAQNACKRAVALNVSLSSGRTCLGLLYAGTGRYQESIREYQTALRLEPTNDDIYRLLASAFAKTDRSEEEEKVFRQAIAFRPHYWAGYNSLGALYNQQARYTEAAEKFAQVVALAPDNYRGYTNLGGARMALGEYNEAIDLLEKSVAIRPTTGNYSNLGTAYFFRGKFAGAIRAYKEAIRLDDNNYVAWGNLGDAYYSGPGTRPQAAEAYQTAIARAEPEMNLNEKDAVLLSQVTTYYAMLQEKEKALSLLKKALALNPRDPNVCYAAGVAYNQFRDVNIALGWLAKAVASGYSTTFIRDTPIFDNLWGDPRFQDLLRAR